VATNTNKTVPSEESVEDFLTAVADEQMRADSFTLLALLREITGMEPKMWGSSIVGFGSYRYKYESGREGDMALAAFSPRKANLTIYGMGAIVEQVDLLKKLGKYSTSKGCLYIKRLSDIDLPTLRTLLEDAFTRAQARAAAH
jgi:hypothetical protein